MILHGQRIHTASNVTRAQLVAKLKMISQDQKLEQTKVVARDTSMSRESISLLSSYIKSNQ